MENREIRFKAFEPRPREAKSGRRRLIVYAIGAVVTLGGLLVALFLGTLGYDVRRSTMHEARLRGILVQEPTIYQVTEGLKEKAPLVAVVESPEELEEAAARWGGDRKDEILGKGKSWPQLRVFAAGDMMYFVYFDEQDIMRDYVFASH